MKVTPVIVASVLTVVLCLQHVEGDDVCRVKHTGKMLSFSNSKVNVRVPCNYEGANFMCEGYKIKVVPGQALDGKNRYFTKSIWISIVKEGTAYYWKGRTSSKLVQRYFEDKLTRTPFATKEENLIGAPFSVVPGFDDNDYMVTLGVDDADFEINFYGYDEKDKQRRKKAGVEIVCPEASFPDFSDYPSTLCGNGSDSRALRNRKKELAFGSKTRTVLYDILDNEKITQTNPQCEIAVQVFKSCPVDRTDVINDCQKLVTSNQMMKCLDKYDVDPMNAFVYCLKYKCNNDADSCDLLKEALDGCSNIPALPSGSTCPLSGVP